MSNMILTHISAHHVRQNFLSTRPQCRYRSQRDWSQKMTRWVGAQGQVISVTKIQKHACIVTSPEEKPKHKTTFFFKMN